MKRKLIAVGLVTVAAVAGTIFSFKPFATDATEVSSGGRYAALGDSVAAGAGLTGSTADLPCGRSTEAYPTQVAAAVGMTLQHVACGGAKADEGLDGPQTVSHARLTPQLARRGQRSLESDQHGLELHAHHRRRSGGSIPFWACGRSRRLWRLRAAGVHG
jgi:hypothetical protein